MKLVIVGGVAGGASAAARARRVDENAEIVMFERGEFISFANCGLPYHVGEVIPERSKLLVMTPQKFKKRFNIDVRTRNDVISINRDRKTVTVRRTDEGEIYEECYDKLILATGSSPIHPPIPGVSDPDVMPLWTIPDMDRIKARVDSGAKRAVVIGAGFIGLEVAENLVERGVQTTVVEMLPQVLPTMDKEMANPIAKELEKHGVNLLLDSRVTAIHRPETDTEVSSELQVVIDGRNNIVADFVVLSVGVKPNSELAVQAGLDTGERGGIKVDTRMQTSDPDIFAVGDVTEIFNAVTGKPAQIPLAGPANREGRIAADNALGRETFFKGALGTNIVKVFDLGAGSAGCSERQLNNDGIPYRKVYVHPMSHAGYYPGACPVSIKLLFNDAGKILGVQVIGYDGVDKRIDVIATAMASGLAVEDLADLELAYAPPYGSARDAVNYAGMVAANVLRGDTDVVHVDNIPEDAVLLDVREPDETAEGTLPNAVLIPLGKLRDRLGELPRDRKIVVYCKVGLRGYVGERILKLNGFDAANLSGGWTTYQHFWG